MKKLRFYIFFCLVLLFGCKDLSYQFVSSVEKKVIGYTTTDDSVHFVFNEDNFMNYIDVSKIKFFESPHSPEFQFWENQLIKKFKVNIEKVNIIGTFNNYQLAPEYTLKKGKENKTWHISIHKDAITPKGGEFSFVINDRFLATPNYYQSLNIYIPLFVEHEFKRVYIVWLMYILDTKKEMGYRIHQDSITYIFNPSHYNLSNDIYGITKTYDTDLIDKVEVAGSFNKWSKYYKMEKKGDVYEKTFPLDDNINNWGEFKFIVNNGEWVNPPFEALNKLGHNYGIRHYNFTYKTGYKENIRGYTIENDSVIFQWNLQKNDLLTYYNRTEAHQFKIKNMYLFGSFIKEKKNKSLMNEIKPNVYRLALPLSDFEKEKHYNFNFFVNGILELTPSYDASNLSHTDLWNEVQTVRFDLYIPKKNHLDKKLTKVK